MLSILEVLYSSLVLRKLCPMKHRLVVSLMCPTCKFFIRLDICSQAGLKRKFEI